MEQQLKLIIGCDLAAYDFKCEVLRVMRANGYKIDDVGCNSSKEGLYTVAAKKVADEVAIGNYDYGILICGTGQGMAMAANKVSGIRAVLCYDVLPAVLSKEHNNGNILCTGAWFKRMEIGVNEFGEKQSINVIQKGPANADAASQVQVIDDLINQGVDALCVVPIDPGAIEASLENAMAKGIVVVTHEASNQVNTLFDVEAFTADDFGAALMDALAAEMGEKGKYALMVAYTTSTTHMEYATAQHERQLEAYPNMELINNGAVPTCESEESIDTSYERAKEVLKANPDLKGFTGVASTDCPGIAKAVEELGLAGQVKIVGVGTPNEFKTYVKSGTISKIKLWDPKDAGYAMCSIAAKILAGEEVGDGSDLGIKGYESVKLSKGANKCLIGQADIEITADNIDNYDF